MIVFSGYGILIPVFYFIGAGAVAMLGAALRMDILKNAALCAWGGAAMVWLFAKTIGRSSERRLLDPKTGRQVSLISSHTIFFMGGKFWTVVAMIFAIFLSVVSLREGGNHSLLSEIASASRGAKAFIEADKHLSGADAVDSGNSKEAAELARGVSNALSKLRMKTTETGSEMTGLTGRFITYCLLSSDACVLLVHAEKLEERTPNEKAVIVDASWAMAQMHLAERDPKPAHLAVAVRGTKRYESVWTGVPAPLDPNGEAAGVRKRLGGAGTSALFAYFEHPAGPKTTATAENRKAEEPQAPQVRKQEVTASLPDAAAKTVERPTPAETPLPPTPSLPTPEREWKSADGRPLRAALLRVTNDEKPSGVFRRADGQEFTIFFEKFVPEDQAVLKTFLSPAK